MNEAVLNPSQYKTVGEFYNDARARGYRVPLPMCNGLTQLMKSRELNFSEAYSLLLAEGKIILVAKHFIFDLSPISPVH